ncbi:MAG: hypothetical protein AAF485_03550 [Chloroflexota bacterium]
MNWSDKVTAGAGNFEKAWEAIAQKTAPVTAALGMGLLYAWLIQNQVGGIYGWIMGGISAIGLEFGGMLTIQTAVKEKGWWIVPAVLYVITHIATIILIEIFHVQSTVAVSVALVVVSVLAYLSRGKYVSEEKAQAEELKDHQTEISKQSQEILAQAELLKKLEADGLTLNKNGKVVRMRSKSAPNSTPKREKEATLRWPLSPEVKRAVLRLTWSEFCREHGHVASSTFYGWLERIESRESENV